MKPILSVLAFLLSAVLLAAGPAVPILRGYTLAASDRERADETRFVDLPSAGGALDTANVIGARPHYAGSDGDHKLAIYMRDKLRAFGFEADLETVRARVDYPQKLALELLTDARYVPTTTALKRTRGLAPIGLDLREIPEPSDPPTADSEVSTPFNSGSADGDVTAPLVFVNRGLDDDYATLANAHVDVAHAIVLVRYGGQFRGLLAERAQAHGAAGVIFYSDPKDDGAARGAVYPNGPWRPSTAVQRGSIGTNIHIPTLPISSANAQILLAALQGVPGPAGWGGALPVAYPLARGPARVHLVVQLSRTIKTLWNTIGRIRGIRGDQFVMLGAHRDAWVAGVGDNGAGIITMLEAARGLGYLAKSGWRPQRTIIIAGWDGEEIGLVGSTAYVHRHAIELNAGCIAYLNADENVTGATFGAEAVAAIGPTIVDTTRDVRDPGAERTAIYDRWMRQVHARDPAADRPNLGNPGGGSDHEPFLFDAGVPVGSMGFNGPYGVYHSSYDTVRYATMFSDPGFVFHQTAAQLYGVAAMRLADATVVPYAFSGYTTLLRTGYTQIVARAQREHLDVDLVSLSAAIDGFALAATRIDARIAVASIDLPEHELSAVHVLDGLVYGRNGYASVAFPSINAAFAGGSAVTVNAALAEAAKAVGQATSALSI